MTLLESTSCHRHSFQPSQNSLLITSGECDWLFLSTCLSSLSNLEERCLMIDLENCRFRGSWITFMLSEKRLLSVSRSLWRHLALTGQRRSLFQKVLYYEDIVENNKCLFSSRVIRRAKLLEANDDAVLRQPALGSAFESKKDHYCNFSDCSI